MVVSSPAPSPASSPACSKAPAVGTEVLGPSPLPKPAPNPVLPRVVPDPVVHSGPNPPLGPNCDLRSRGMGKFPPRLAKEPRPKNGPHAYVNLPQLPLRGSSNTKSSPIPPLRTKIAAAVQDEDILTLEMRPARLPVSSLWHRLRFSGFSPMASQRRSTWKPGKPRRGRPEGTKGAGSRSI